MSNLDYITSKDYPLLKELLDQGKRVVCFISYEQPHGLSKATDIAYARKSIFHDIEYLVGVRGNCYFSSFEKEGNFIQLCEEFSLEFIPPICLITMKFKG